MTAWRFNQNITHLFSAKAKTPTHVTYQSAIAFFTLLSMVVSIRQIVISARHRVSIATSGRVPVSVEVLLMCC
jgi:hypothetical protein